MASGLFAATSSILTPPCEEAMITGPYKEFFNSQATSLLCNNITLKDLSIIMAK